jgi:hypothetical protein
VSEPSTATPVFPPGRYGRRRDPAGSRRGPALALGVVVALLALLLAGLLYQRWGDHTYTGQLVAFTDITDDGVTVRLQARKPAGKAGVCRVRALASDHSEAGYAEITLPTGHARPALSYRIATTARPVAAELLGCGPAAR